MSRELHAVFFLSLLLIFILPTQQFQLNAGHEEADECTIRTEFVAHELTNCVKASSVGASTFLTKSVEETRTLLKQQMEGTKDHTDQLTRILDKIENIADTLGKMQGQGLENADAIKLIKDCQKYTHLRNIIGSQFVNALGRIFHYNATRRFKWKDAQDYCQQKSMQPAILKTLIEVEAVKTELRNCKFHDKIFWLSASDIGRTAGQFQWTDGTPVDKATWQSGEPNSFGKGKEACVYLDTGFAKLLDWSCTTSGPYILCEVPAALASCL